MMEISIKRSGLFAGPIFIVAAITMAGTSAARAACADVVAAFDKAVAAHAMNDAIRSFEDISDNPSAGCLGRHQEFRVRLADFLIEHAGTPDLAAADRERALSAAARTLETSADWRGKQKLADYYFAHGERLKAHQWYEESVAVLATPGFAATDQERHDLMTRLAAAQSLAGDDKGDPRPLPSTRCRMAACGGAAIVPVPIPIQFAANLTAFTPLGERALQELVEAAKQIPALTLVGHVAPRGRTREDNMDLSRRRVIAVRDKLVENGVKAEIAIAWKGDTEPFDVSALPDGGQLSQDEIWQLDDRVEWVGPVQPQ
jgi:outer membrane protein OmpA-like peptidoglycan-associated protein